ncbi:hypothetical protein GCM10009801_64230 [Streptomyces albiaxialis]|uniref:Cupin 2 conserved barrel domain-containing protein n=1 Tax=Streptomyces albiaxialis TaxID=329523 RepID=A0ABN2WN33_9ACTN
MISTVVAENFERWSEPLHKEFAELAHSGRAGQTLVRETGTLRVWETRLAPGERLPVHRHVLDYFWIALTDGHARQHAGDGSSREVTFVRGQTLYFPLAEGRHHLHDLKNIGEAELAFLVIEEKGPGNAPLPLD